MTLHSFLGGINFSTATKLTKSWSGLPSGYQKVISFHALLYGANNNPSVLRVKVNNQLAHLNSNY